MWAHFGAFLSKNPKQDFFQIIRLCHFLSYMPPYLRAKSQEILTSVSRERLRTNGQTDKRKRTNVQCTDAISKELDVVGPKSW